MTSSADPTTVRPADTSAPCLVCGRTPTADVRFQGPHGIPDTEWPHAVIGPFCRECGEATFRRTTEWHLGRSWCSIPALFTVLENLSARRSIRKLSAPAGEARATMPPGRPMWQRRRTASVLVPIVVVIAAVVFGTNAAVHYRSNQLDVGSCIRFSNPHSGDLGDVHVTVTQATQVSCNDPHTGVVTAQVTSSSQCADDDVLLSDNRTGNEYCVSMN